MQQECYADGCLCQRKSNNLLSSSPSVLLQGAYQTNVLLAGFDEGVGPSLYYLDYLATLHKVKHTAFGYCKSLSLEESCRTCFV